MKVHNIIGGIKTPTSSYYTLSSPYDFRPIGEAPKTTTKEVIDAISSLKLPGDPPWRRAELLEKVAEELEANKGAFASILSSEIAKPYLLAVKEVEAAAMRFRYAASEARLMSRGELIDGGGSKDKEGKLAITLREPYGVVSAIVPFNYPIAIASSKIAPALASGNAVIVKPSSLSPISTFKLCELVSKYFDGAISAVNPISDDAKTLLATHKKISLVSFTGSTKVGSKIASLSEFKKLLLELGGKGLAIVLDDADPKQAAKEIAVGALTFSGQRCDAIGKVLVSPNLKEDLVKFLLEEIREFKMGDPSEPMTKMSSLISEDAVKRVHSLVKDALEKGAKLLAGGMFQKTTYHPTLLVDVNEDMRISKEEVFGPVISVQEVADESEIVKIANQSGYGLDSAIFSLDLKRALSLAKKLPDGEVTINRHPSHGIGYFPFGGNGLSGLGREGVRQSFLEMTRTKTIVFEGP